METINKLNLIALLIISRRMAKTGKHILFFDHIGEEFRIEQRTEKPIAADDILAILSARDINEGLKPATWNKIAKKLKTREAVDGKENHR